MPQMTRCTLPFIMLAFFALVDAAQAAPVPGRTATTFAGAFFISRGSILGTAIIWFLLALSVFGIGLIGYMWIVNRRINILPDESVERARQHVAAGQYRELLALASADSSYFGAVLAAALREASHGFGAMTAALGQAADEFTARRLRRIEALNIIGNVAPMIGLFGTVYGMILAFQTIVAAGGRPSPVDLAAGIGTALVTTFWGLLIAIPCLAAYAVIRNTVEALTSEAMLVAQDLLNNFRPTAKPQAAGQGPVPSPAVPVPGTHPVAPSSRHPVKGAQPRTVGSGDPRSGGAP